MSDRYIPKVGDECEVLNSSLGFATYEKCIILFIGKHVVVYTSESCKERSARVENLSFRPTPTKADVERELLRGIALKYLNSELDCQYIAQHAQKAGFTIPKKVKRSEIHNLIWDSKLNGSEKDALELIKQTCELLGDLVEDEA